MFTWVWATSFHIGIISYVKNSLVWTWLILNQILKHNMPMQQLSCHMTNSLVWITSLILNQTFNMPMQQLFSVLDVWPRINKDIHARESLWHDANLCRLSTCARVNELCVSLIYVYYGWRWDRKTYFRQGLLQFYWLDSMPINLNIKLGIPNLKICYVGCAQYNIVDLPTNKIPCDFNVLYSHNVLSTQWTSTKSLTSFPQD